MTATLAETTASSLVFFHGQTPLHPGAGTAVGVVDLPIQRERHTQWPTIPGSSIKGVFRDACRDDADPAAWTSVFGPETENADKHAGALSLTDARLLAFPVRSLHGVFAYATCRAALQRMRRDLGLVGKADQVPVPPPIPVGQALVAQGAPVLVGSEEMVLEEFDFGVTDWPELGSLAERLAGWISADPEFAAEFVPRLVVLDDDHFTHFARHATEVVARIKLDYERKTVSRGALFYQEFLPAETVMYSLLIARPSRDGSGKSAADVLNYVRNRLPVVLQLGGDETTGKGFCHVHVADV
ncbi:MAG: type III-B CRISPR module RAMP protein Cmr4 [Pirellulaceae bacterium]|nr:MAG: type III-B CRISPR module RAMP protein Cmr4 [Pirellulaceae bacterium]